jgi:hypothetical protein
VPFHKFAERGDLGFGDCGTDVASEVEEVTKEGNVAEVDDSTQAYPINVKIEESFFRNACSR